jgi:glutathione S-transferase
MSHELTLYWGSGSPVSWRALLALAIKEISYTSHRLNLGEKEHRSEEFLALSPRGTFPILVHGDYVIGESLAILNYLEAIVPTPSIFGSSAQELAQIWQHIGEHESYLGSSVQTITRAFFRKNGLSNTSPDVLSSALSQANEELGRLNETMENHDWLVGDQVSAADIVYYPTLHRLLRAAQKDVAAEHGLGPEPLAALPNLSGWLQRLGALNGVEATYPPHWRA